MYHYVRPTDPELPYLFYLNLEDFEKQLDFFESEYGIISHQEWLDFVRRPDEVPSGVVLTFDDGLKDHYKFVYPTLKKRNLWGIFYVPTSIFNEKKMLNVHKVHYILGKFEGSKVLEVLKRVVREEHFIDGFYSKLVGELYNNQKMDEESLKVKKIFNYSLKPESKDTVMRLIFEELGISEEAVFKDFYVSEDELREMEKDGFTIGAHSKSHNLLTKFSGDELKSEVVGSINELNKILSVDDSETFCFPYGGPDSWNQEVLDYLSKSNIKYCFAVNSADITSYEMKTTPLHLSRYDCNQFPYGKSRRVK